MMTSCISQVCVSLLSAVDQLIFVGAFKTRLDSIIFPQLLSMLKELLGVTWEDLSDFITTTAQRQWWNSYSS